MSGLQSSLFSPLGREYCLYFYYLAVFAFIFMLLTAAHNLYLVFSGDADLLPAILSLIGPFILYFNNRLLYSMCVH